MMVADVLVSTATRTVVLTRGRYAVCIDGVPTDRIPEFGQLAITVESEADVLHALCMAGYRIGGSDPIEIYGRRDGITTRLDGVPSRVISEILGLDAVRVAR